MHPLSVALLVAVAATASGAPNFGYYGRPHQGNRYYIVNSRQPQSTGMVNNAGNSQAKYASNGYANGQSISTGNGNAQGNKLDNTEFVGYSKEYNKATYNTIAESDGKSDTNSVQKGHSQVDYTMTDPSGYTSAKGSTSQSFAVENKANEKYKTGSEGKEESGGSLEGKITSQQKAEDKYDQAIKSEAKNQYNAEDKTVADATASFKNQEQTHRSNVPDDAARNGYPVADRLSNGHANQWVYSPATAKNGDAHGVIGHNGVVAANGVEIVDAGKVGAMDVHAAPVNAANFATPAAATNLANAHTAVAVNPQAGTAGAVAQNVY